MYMYMYTIKFNKEHVKNFYSRVQSQLSLLSPLQPLALDVMCSTLQHSPPEPLEAGYTNNTLHSTPLELKIQNPNPCVPPFYLNCIYLKFD